MNIKQEKHLMHHAEKDEIYHEILSIRSIYEHDFKRILRTLSPEDQHCLKMYIKACVAVEERISHTAYFLTPEI